MGLVMLLRIFRLARQLHVVFTALDPGIVKTEVVNTWVDDIRAVHSGVL
jgi:hypothetical protein